MATQNIFTKDSTGQFTRQIPVATAQNNFTNNFGRTLPLVDTSVTTPTRTIDSPTQTQRTGNFNGNIYNVDANGVPYGAPISLANSATPTTSATTTPIQTSNKSTTTNNPYDAFNLLLQKSLKTAQKIDTTDLLKRQRELQRERISLAEGTGVQTSIPGELGGLSPSQYNQIRNAQQESTTTAIEENTYQIARLNQERKNLIEQIMLAKDSGDKARETALEKEYKDKQIALEEKKLAETIRSNKVDETSKNTLSSVLSSITGKPLSDTERVARGYAERLSASDAIISSIGSKFTEPLSLGGFLPNQLQSSERQQYEQAKRDFVNAALRKESGAAISDTEFDSAAKQYFPQAGDSPEVVAQKTANRKLKVQALQFESGQIISSTENGNTTGVTPSGIKYTITK